MTIAVMRKGEPMIQIDMPKPETCKECFARDGVFCKASEYKRISYPELETKAEWCPIHEVTTDEDTISRKQAIEVCFNGWNKEYRAIVEDIKQLPPSPTPNAPKTLDSNTQHAQPTGTPLHDSGSDYAHGFADGYKQGLKDAESERVRCKDCKHWKDSDGVYRRGIGAESKCPVNIRAVYEGNFYCADAERRTDE